MTAAFDGRVQQIGDRLIILVPEGVSGALPSRGQVAVEAQVNGRAWATVVEPDGPEDFESALADAADLAEPWAGITPMARWEWVRWVGATKNPQTRERRIEVSVDKLRQGSRRPCCFDLSSCTDPELSRSGKLVDTSTGPESRHERPRPAPASP